MSVSFRNRLILGILFVILVPVFSTAQVAWVKDFDNALKRAAKEKKFVVLDMSASW
jgi:hypothetical protein